MNVWMTVDLFDFFSLMSLTFPVSYTLLCINKITEIEMITKPLSEIHTQYLFSDFSNQFCSY